MFGSKLKTWMENYIGRPRKKELQKDKFKENERGGVILESSESLAQSDTGISSSSQQVLSSSTTDNREGYSTTTMESERSGMSHCQTAVSLPSPESAYSTGYSTDGASSGGTGPPEYYINLRTGKHYFPSPAMTPTSPQPNPDYLNLTCPNQRLKSSFPHESSCIPIRTLQTREPYFSYDKTRLKPFSGTFNGFSPHSIDPDIESSTPKQNTLSTSIPTHFELFSFSKSPLKKSSAKSQLTSLKLFLKSPKREKEKCKLELEKSPILDNKKSITVSGKPKKWFKQPFQKLGQRKIESVDENIPRFEVKKDIPLEKNFSYLISQENSASPRQRNRIKTNPWLPPEPLSSINCYNFPINFSPSLQRNRSCSNTPLQNRKINGPDLLSTRVRQLSLKPDEPKDRKISLEKAVIRHFEGKLGIDVSDHSEDDLTLNEMMGTYNESYVYEKETDILSDSDPTDCEDYGTDSEANNGGDERDSHDDELDFIDNGSITETDESFPRNTGKCTYYDFRIKKNSFLCKGDRHHSKRDSERRKNSKKDHDLRSRREKRRLSRKSFKKDDEEKRKDFLETRNVKAEIDENVGGLNLSRVLAQRILAKSTPKSVEGTPLTVKRQKMNQELRETHIGNDKTNTDGKKYCDFNDTCLGDVEADDKYNQLIKEAENMFEIMRNSPIIKTRKQINVSGNKNETRPQSEKSTESLDDWSQTETKTCTSSSEKRLETITRKSPKDLGLQLSGETPKKLKRLNFDTSKKSSFKARSSAHSPLDPLGPGLRNFAVFKPSNHDDRKVSTSSSEDWENGKNFDEKPLENKCPPVLGSPVIPIAFQSVDLGKPLTSYCPQSEPVKRKIYSCSKTYDKLVKQFETKSPIFEENNGGAINCGRGHNLCLNGNQGSLRNSDRGGLRPPAVPPRRLIKSNETFTSKTSQFQSVDTDIVM